MARQWVKKALCVGLACWLAMAVAFAVPVTATESAEEPGCPAVVTPHNRNEGERRDD